MKKIIAVFTVVALWSSCIRNEKISPSNQSVENEQIDDTLKSGVFITRDAGHPTSGTVYLIQKKNGSKLLQFVNLSTGSGPDVDVLMSRSEVYNTKEVVKIDDLKYSGTFFIDLPAQLNVADYHTVMIWCEEFDILFATCKLQ